MKAILAAIAAIDRMNLARGTRFHVGQRITVDGKPGVIVGANSPENLDVLFDGEMRPSNCHPGWKVEAAK